MAHRTLHPIVLAGVLLALPIVVAWAPAQAARNEKEIATPQCATSVVLPIEIAEQGYAPVQKQIEVQLETVPEPSSLLLLTTSSLLLLRRRRSN
jgi:PEP-CTERM motif